MNSFEEWLESNYPKGIMIRHRDPFDTDKLIQEILKFMEDSFEGGKDFQRRKEQEFNF